MMTPKKKSIGQQLRELPEKLGIDESSPAKIELGRFLHQIVHDLSTPLGIYKMELYSLRSIDRRLKKAVETNDMETVRRQVEILEEILSNMEGGQGTATEIVGAIQEAGKRLKEAEERRPMNE